MTRSSAAFASALPRRLARPKEAPIAPPRHITRKVCAWIVALAALSQSAALAIAAWFTSAGGSATILHWRNQTVDRAVWHAPNSGFIGAAGAAGEALSLLVALGASAFGRGLLRHAGHAVLLAWICFWLQGCVRLAIVMGDWELWAIAGLCLVVAVSQVIVWRSPSDRTSGGAGGGAGAP